MKRFFATFTWFFFVAGTPAVFGAGAGGGSALQPPSAPPDFSQIPQAPTVGSLLPKKTPKIADAATPYNEGLALLKAKKYADAALKFEISLDANPRAPQAHLLAAYCQRQMGQASYAAALQHLNAALKLNPKYGEAYESRGVLYVKMGKIEDAQKDLATLKLVNPKLTPGLEAAIKTGKDLDRYE
jgi:tetratricopeptide (TPR) repeat protein